MRTVNNQTVWAKTLLGRLGIRPSHGAVKALVGWANAEGGHWHNSANFNPLNTTLRLPGSSVMGGGNTAGVQSYRNWAQGLKATADTLRNYPGVLSALRAGDAMQVANAVGSSPWGTNAGLLRSAIASAHPGGGQAVGSLTGSGGSGGSYGGGGSLLAQVSRPDLQAERQQMLLNYVDQRGQPDALLNLALGLRGLKDTAATTAQPSYSTAPGGSASPRSSGGGGTVTFDGKPVLAKFVDELKWARQHGWKGTVTSGVRTKQQQLAAARNYGLQHYGPAGPLGSNHVTGHAGAVDVTQAAQLDALLKKYPGRRNLIWGGPVMGDWVHFSPTGH
jgi:hypothetical protein